MKRKLYIAATPDEYELPLFVTDSARELADWLGIKEESVLQKINRQQRRPRNLTRGQCAALLYRVVIDDDEED